MSTTFNEGYFIAPSEDASINIILEMKDDENRTIYTNEIPRKLHT